MKPITILTILCSTILSINSMTSANRQLNNGWQMRQLGTEKWYAATVPGCVHTDLLNNKQIADPFFRLNEHDLQWIDKTAWEYMCSFDISDEEFARTKKTIRFNGLDTFALIFLNDILIAETDNMFCVYEYDISKVLHVGDNTLRIVFDSPIERGLELYDKYPYVLPTSDNDLAAIGKVEGEKKVSVFTRKAGYHFGWDWGCRLVTSGIWRPIEILFWDDFRINDMFIRQAALSPDKAHCTAELTLTAELPQSATASVFANDKWLCTAPIDILLGENIYRVGFDIDDPQLWYPNGMGEQPLYNIEVRLSNDIKSESAHKQIGLRTIELVREDDDAGKSFYFKVNGTPVFMKGANYISNDPFPSRVPKQKYEEIIATAKECNFNMLRVWGGGYYEDDYFYYLCDKAGILVWQDFMFACSMYPASEDYLKSVEKEAVDNILRLRNHPSVALWCGNNEILTAWRNKGPKERKKNAINADDMWKGYEAIFHRLLPDVVNRYDSGRPYWSSSPSSGEGIVPQLNTGDGHYWGVWWAKKPFETYAIEISRFMSEYGFQSFPEMSTIRQFALPEDYDIYSEVMKSHQRSSIGNQTIEYYMKQYYGVPERFESFIYLGQVMQGEAIRYAIESHRRARPFCMGSLYWQINDCWPVASWSSMDYYLKWKAEQYMVRRAFENVLISPFIDGDKVKIALINDTSKALKGNVFIRISDFNGKILFEKSLQASAAANGTSEIWSNRIDDIIKDRSNCFLSAEFRCDETVSTNVLYFCRPVEMDLPDAKILHNIKRLKNGIFTVTLSSKTLIKDLFLDFDGADVTLSDNWFDLLPQEKRSIEIRSSLTAKELSDKLTIKCYNSIRKQ